MNSLYKVVTFSLLTLGTCAVNAGTEVVTRVRPTLLPSSPLYEAAYQAAQQVVDSVKGPNTFDYLGRVKRTFDPLYTVVQPSVGKFIINGIYYSKEYSVSIHTTDGGKIVGAVAGAVVGGLVGGDKNWEKGAGAGALLGGAVGSYTDISSLQVEGAFPFTIELLYSHSLDSIDFVPLWECTSVTIHNPLSLETEETKERELETQRRIAATIKEYDLLANEYWVAANELKAKADSLRLLKK